ncbi:MAG: hypothetical protein JWP11_1299 [Frankiales bacterium]|nr:hypothetical protein [Frankiales bacterium]
MKLSEALEIFLRDQPVVDAVSKQLEEAKKTLKAHCASKRLTTYRGCTYSETPYAKFDVALARTALGPKKTAACTVDAVRASLALPPHLRRGAVVLERSA